MSSLRLLRFCAANPERRWNSRKRKPIRSGALYALALAHFANGDRAEADAALKKLINENADSGASQIAQVYALRKEPDKMFEWLEHGWPTNDPGVGELLHNAFLRAYKDDPRFIAFAQKVGVMPKAAAAKR